MRKTSYKCTTKTKEKLLGAIIKLVKEKGYNNVTIRDICRESGVSTGAFYHHYGSKDALSKEAYYNIDRLVTADFIKECNSLPPLDGLHNLLEKHVYYVADEVGLVIIEYHKVLLEGVNISIFDAARPYYQAIKHQLTRCIETSILTKEYSSDYLTEYTIRFIRGLIFDWCIHGGTYDLKERFETDFTIMMNGFANNHINVFPYKRRSTSE